MRYDKVVEDAVRASFVYDPVTGDVSWASRGASRRVSKKAGYLRKDGYIDLDLMAGGGSQAYAAGPSAQETAANEAARVKAGEDAETYMDANANVWCANTGEHFGQTHMSNYECNGRWINIVLTIAHLDHTPENCADENLRALCQRCHLKHDREHHAETAKATRRARLQTPELF